MAQHFKELCQFLQTDSRDDLKAIALDYITGLCAAEKGVKTIIDTSPEILASLVKLLNDKNRNVARQACICLVNITASDGGADVLTAKPDSMENPQKHIVNVLLKCIFDPESVLADQCCVILSNLTRFSYVVEGIVDTIESSGKSFDEIIDVFTKKNYSQKGAKYHYLGPVLSNLTQSARVRRYFLDREKCVIQRLLPFTEYKLSQIRRSGVVGMLKNCCFEIDSHEWLLGENIDILPRLLLPLAGNETFDDEDNDKLPLELQYLPETKVREDDPEIRYTLLEAISQLCAKRVNREFIRDKNTYLILRELHKWEKDSKVLFLCEELVNILIRTEEEIGVDNLRGVQIPEHIQNQLAQTEAHKLTNGHS